MSTADKAEKQAGHGAAWANLIVCGGISWAVSLWHATHATKGSALVLAILAATAPVVTAAFASHNIAQKGAGAARKVLTCIVFVMGMSLSVKAQAQSIGPIVGGIPLGVVFALMLDVSTFISLSSIMSKPAAETPESTPAESPVSAPAAPPVGAPADRLPERLPTARQAPPGPPAAPPVQAPAGPPADRPKKTQKAPAAKAPKAKKLTPAETRAKAWELLKADPDMSAPALATALGKSPTSGHVRDMKATILREMQESGELPSVRAIGA